MDGIIDESDPAKLLKDPLFVKDGGYSVRLLVLPSKTGKVLAWLVAAPMDLDTLTVRANLAGAAVDSPVIPTTAVKLALGKHQMEC